MGIDGIEFDKSHHQNLGTFQETWLFQNFLFGLKIGLSWPNHILKIQQKIHFFKLEGVEVSFFNDILTDPACTTHSHNVLCSLLGDTSTP